MKIILIYPNQLYSNHPALRKDQKIVIVEDPLFFGDQQYPLNLSNLWPKNKHQIHI